jgi:hypothetical protein
MPKVSKDTQVVLQIFSKTPTHPIVIEPKRVGGVIKSGRTTKLPQRFKQT